MGVNEEKTSGGSRVQMELFQEIFGKTEPNLVIENLEERFGSGRGDNYTATLYRILLKGYIMSDETHKKLKWEKSVICKLLPNNKAQRDAYHSDDLFRNEIEFYNHIIPELVKFQRNKATESFSAIPSCYFAKSDLIILEDLRTRNFEMPDRRAGLTVEQIEAVLIQLAKLHALSLAYKDQHSNEFSKLRNRITEGIFSRSNVDWYKNYYKKLTKNAHDMVSEILTPKYMERFEKFINLESFFLNMVELIEKESPLAVICHGDCWTNNFLYKYDSKGVILETCLLDFQLVRYGSPVLDISSLIYCCTDKQLRDNHMNKLIELYHSELVESLKQCGHLPSFCGSEEELLAKLKAEMLIYGRFGLGIALDMLPISTCSSDEAPDLYIHNSDEITGAPELTMLPNELCKRKMADLVIDMVDSGIL